MNSYLNKFPLLAHLALATILILPLANTSFAQPEEVFALRMGTQPFSSTMCKKIRPNDNLRIQIARHRDLILRKVPNQFIPKQSEEARKKSYVHFLTFHDLTNGAIKQGAIAFNETHAVVFTENNPRGLSREEFVSQLPSLQIPVADKALNTFLRLHRILNAAIDGCRPYPSQVTYGTDDEIDKIEAGRLAYRDLAKHYNIHPSPHKALVQYERGTSGGFYDPRSQGKHVSYLAANPLYFYQSNFSTR